MKETRIMMGMTITVDIPNSAEAKRGIEKVFSYFTYIDETFSTYKETSEISKINKGLLKIEEASVDMQKVFKLSEETKKITGGFFDIKRADGLYDPSGLVKGWAIFNAAEILRAEGLKDFYIDAGGDIEARGLNAEGKAWSVGIRNPFNVKEVVKVINVSNKGVATSGTYARGQHIYNPHVPEEKFTDIVSLTVVGPNVYEADRFATAAFAMGRKGVEFIEQLEGFEGYAIDYKGIATMTSGFQDVIPAQAGIQI